MGEGSGEGSGETRDFSGWVLGLWIALSAVSFVYSVRMKGLHLTADLYQCRCDAAWLTDPQQLAAWCRQAVDAVGLEPVNELFQAAPGNAGGVTAAILLAESHVCLHTFPDKKAASLDVYVCHNGEDHSAKARGLMYALVNRFAPEWTEQRSLDRGDGDS